MKYSENFLYAVRHTLEAEGVLSDDAGDYGGLTKYGISQRWNPEVNVSALTRDGAIDIYYRKYWLEPNLHLLDDKYVAAEIFDTGVNESPRDGVAYAQRAYNALSTGHLLEDGKLGPKTADALNRFAKRYRIALVTAMNVIQGMEYLEKLRKDPDYVKGRIRGWMKRCLPIGILDDE